MAYYLLLRNIFNISILPSIEATQTVLLAPFKRLLLEPFTEKTPGLFSRVPPTPQHIKELGEHFLHCLEIDGVMYSYNLLDGSVYSLGSLQLEHAEPKAEIKEKASKELEEIRTTPELLANFIRKYTVLTRHWSLRKDLDILVDSIAGHSTRELKTAFRTAKGLSDRKAPDKLDFTLWLLEDKSSIVADDVASHALFSTPIDSYAGQLHKSYSSFLFEDEANHWLLDAHGNLDKSGADFCDWLSDTILNRTDHLVQKYSNTLIEYLYYYSSQSPDFSQSREEFETRILENLVGHKEDASKSEVFQSLFVVEGSLIKVGQSKMGLGQSLQHFYLKRNFAEIKISQLLHTKNEFLSEIVQDTLDVIKLRSTDRRDRLKLQSLVMWLLKNVDQHQKDAVNEFIETIGSFFPLLGAQLEKRKCKIIVAMSPSGNSRQFNLEDALAFTLGMGSDSDSEDL